MITKKVNRFLRKESGHIVSIQIVKDETAKPMLVELGSSASGLIIGTLFSGAFGIGCIAGYAYLAMLPKDGV
jgi:hypothetical protein